MARNALSGSRIRERRMSLKIRQADLARSVGISASYLNLIEHNRRRIAGKLLLDIAQELQVDASQLSEGTEAVLLEQLSDVADAQLSTTVDPELDRAEEFAGRFPGWAQRLVAQKQKIEALERTVETLTDRLTHDPFLSTSLHEVLSAVTAIRSTSSILLEGEELDPKWQARFHSNIFEDSQRLAQTSQELVQYLDDGADDQSNNMTAHEELDAFLAENKFHFADIEHGKEIETVIAGQTSLVSETSIDMAGAFLRQYQEDVASLPLDQFLAAAQEVDFDPVVLARVLSAPLPTVFRRLAFLPPDMDVPKFGLAVCDASGTLKLRKPVGAFTVPRFGAACPLWPLFQAIMTPHVPLKSTIALPTDMNSSFHTYAFGDATIATGYDAPRQINAYMLLRETDTIMDRQAAQSVGISCRICPKGDCTARREPSILLNTFDIV